MFEKSPPSKDETREIVKVLVEDRRLHPPKKDQQYDPLYSGVVPATTEEA